MSAKFPGRPETVKGAIVALTPNSKRKNIDPDITTLIFQFNPETLTRTFSFLNNEDILDQERKKQNSSSIEQLIDLNLEFDSTYQLEHKNNNTDITKAGLHPTLAALESIMNCQSNTENLTPPVILFFWGPNRIIPVWLYNVKVTEQSFDSNLNPIRVKIDLTMRVRDLEDLKSGSSEYSIFANYLENMQMFERLYSKNKQNHEIFEQVSQNIRKLLSNKKPRLKNIKKRQKR